MAQEALLASQLLVALVMFAVAVVLLWLNFSNTIHRVFALFLLFRGGVIALNQFARLDPGQAELWLGLRGYLAIAVPLILLDFWIVYQWRRATTRRRIVRSAILACGVLFELAFLLDHSLLFVTAAPPEYGPLGVIATTYVAMFAALALWFAMGARITRHGAYRRFQHLMAVGFATAAIADSVITWNTVLRNGWDSLWAPRASPTTLDILGFGSVLIALLLALLAAGLVLSEFSRQPKRHMFSWTLGVLLFSALGPVVARAADPSNEGLFFLFILGTIRLLMPCIIGYAIIRSASSGIDPFLFDAGVRVALRRGTLGTIFLGVYFAVGDVLSETLPNTPWLQDLNPLWAQVLAAAVAGLLLLALQPLKRASERVSSTLIGGETSPSLMSRLEKERLYADQAAIAWSDGSLSRKERQLLDQLRTHLRLPAEIALELEGKAAILGGRRTQSERI